MHFTLSPFGPEIAFPEFPKSVNCRMYRPEKGKMQEAKRETEREVKLAMML